LTFKLETLKIIRKVHRGLNLMSEEKSVSAGSLFHVDDTLAEKGGANIAAI